MKKIALIFTQSLYDMSRFKLMKLDSQFNSLNKLFLVFALLNAFPYLFAQDLYVDTNSFVYARDVVLFVNDDIRLETPTSNLYLRGDAQLLQNTDTKNSDAGELSVYQNQTSGVYEYNFWCSPVGVSADNTQANVAFNGTNIHDPANDADLTNVNSITYPYTTAYNSTATSLASYWMYTLIDAEGYYGWNQIFNTGDAGPGYGFTLKGSPTADNVLDFRGRPNNGNILVSCYFDGTDAEPLVGLPNRVETLSGNPYPSALDLKLFLAENSTILNSEILFWEQAVTNSHNLAAYEGGYGIYIPGPLGDLFDNGIYVPAPFQFYNGNGGGIGGSAGIGTDFLTNNSRRFAAVGQGFVISSIDNGGAPGGGFAEFNNSMRVYFPEDSSAGGDGSIFNKSTSKNTDTTDVVPISHNGVDYKAISKNPTIVPKIRLHTHINETYYKETLIAFRNSTPNNQTYNRFFDGTNAATELNTDVYLISEDKELVIKSIRYDETTRIPFGFKADRDDTKFSIKAFELKDVPENVALYLFDNTIGNYTDIKTGTFDITLPEGVYNNRFEITFSQNSALGIEEDRFKDLSVFQNNAISELKIVNPNALKITQVTLLDVSGKSIMKSNENSSKKRYQYSTRSLSDGVYILKVELSDNQIFSKKLVISNRK
ncbi:T9SS type A sorting domain-containing protein [Changchengzhania lutea]|uniref:T9SS type A sorting domain-containing protein n=1 Tax=Changchengzhania lutea TaxID=2049305 RepID=UPI00163DB0D9|nr:T9SS type A sorting domain-containing protein [Changchengzhania lutea]